MAGLAERWEQSAIKAEELGLLEILVEETVTRLTLTLPP